MSDDRHGKRDEHPVSSIQHLKTSPTFVTELTPLGRAAVAVVLVAGPDALQTVGKFFSPQNGRRVDEIPFGRIAFGRWGNGTGEELIFCRRAQEEVEIHCHGGAAAVHAVIDALVKQGCEPITWQDWTQKCSSDPICAAARIALADAMTERTAAILLDQLNGALAKAVREINTHITTADWNAAIEKIEELLRRRDLGLHLTKPWRVVVCGPPNVGKSSLINALAGYERAIVSATPGTTRDVVTVTTAIDGWPVQLADTAGFRATHDELESAGMALAAASLSEADLAIFLHDATLLHDESPGNETGNMFLELPMPPRTIHVVNKIDLIPIARRPDSLVHLNNSQPEICDSKFVSAITGEGIAELVSTISGSLVPAFLPAGSAVPFTAQQIEYLAHARDAIERQESAKVINLLQAMLTKEDKG